tara:strand:- start:35213 stop:35371 length:159 start_codon:yes stop_codon:yes gene_type:complete
MIAHLSHNYNHLRVNEQPERFKTPPYSLKIINTSALTFSTLLVKEAKVSISQ